MTIEFEATWPGTALGEYRACGSTYERYPYSSVPILDESRFTGAFDWVHAKGTLDPAKTALMADLDRQLTTAGLALPRDFVRYHAYTDLSRTLEAVSGTGCYSTVSPQPIPSPVEPGAFLVRFLNDQQDCVIWYLYLRPGTLPLYLDAREYPDFAKICWCAPTFEQFAYRFWIENRILDALISRPEKPLTADLQAYLEHYQVAHVEPWAGRRSRDSRVSTSQACCSAGQDSRSVTLIPIFARISAQPRPERLGAP
jgi:hypothetical protein